MTDLAELGVPELERRLRTVYDAIQGRVSRCLLEHREFVPAEAHANARDADEMANLRSAIERAERRAQEGTRVEQIPDAIENHQRSNLSPLFPSAQNLALLEAARREYRTLSVIEEPAALKTTDMGTPVEYGPSGLLAPRTLWRSSGVPTTEPPAGYGAWCGEGPRRWLQEAGSCCGMRVRLAVKAREWRRWCGFGAI